MDARREWYDRADLYDAWLGTAVEEERALVLGASRRWGRPSPRRILEPFCGTGRLLRAMPGTAIAIGFDRNRAMLARATRRVFRADAACFAVAPGAFDLAFCLVDSFRHLLTEADAARHLRAVGRALGGGAVYVLGLDVTGDVSGGDVSVAEWTAESDGRRVHGSCRSLGDADPVSRRETVHVRLDAGAEVVEDFFPMRTYAPRQLEDLIDDEGSFEIAAVLDHRCDLDDPVELSEIEGSAVVVLRRDA